MAVTETIETDTTLDIEDIIVMVVYFALVIAISLYASCRAARGTISGYFLAGRQMNFFMVGSSLFVSNIGTEHFIGLAGSGAAGGIGVGAWELNAILLLQLLGFVFVPVYLASKCYTMPEYLYKRFGGSRIQIYFAFLSLLLYIFTKCSVDLYTGAIFIQQSLGWDLYLSIFILIIVVGILTITGGLTAVIYTDTLQAILMVAGAFTITILGLREVGGFEGLWRKYPYAMTNYTVPNETCHYTNKNWYVMLREPTDDEMPWPGFLLGQTPGSIWYWCNDQVMVQRALAAKNLSHAQGATIMAGIIKILPLFIMVIPGMISRVLYPDEVGCVTKEQCMQFCQSAVGCTNIAFPKLVLGILGKGGLRGLMMAVMFAALMSDLDSIFNSASTLFTIGVWKRMRKKAEVKELLIVGRVFVVVMIGVAIAWVPVVKEMQGGQVFIYIQEIINYLAPPIAAVYLIAVLWARCNEQGCFWGLMVGFVTGVTRLILIFVYRPPGKCGDEDTRPSILKDFHYMYFAMLLFWITVIVTVIVSLATDPPSYKKLYRTLFWTRYDHHSQRDVDAGRVVAVWHGLCSYTVAIVKDTQTYDNPALADEDQDTEVIVPGKRTTSTQFNANDAGLKKKSDVYMIPSYGDIEMTNCTSYDVSQNVDADTPNEKQTCRQFIYSWFCGVSTGGLNEQENEAAMRREEMISHLDQTHAVKILLYVLMTMVNCFGVVLYIFWSTWKYNPEGDVWTRLEQGEWNLTSHRADL